MDRKKEIEKKYTEAQIQKKRNERLLYEKIFNRWDNAIWWCPECRIGIMKRNEKKDIPFDKNTFNGEGEWQCWECDLCGHEELEPFD